LTLGADLSNPTALPQALEQARAQDRHPMHLYLSSTVSLPLTRAHLPQPFLLPLRTSTRTLITATPLRSSFGGTSHLLPETRLK